MTLFDEIIEQQGHLALGSLQFVNSMSYEQVEVALSMLFFHKFLDPKQENPLNEPVFQKALLDNLYKLWKQSESFESASSSSTSALQELTFEDCSLVRYLRMPLLKDDSTDFKDGLQKYQKVHVSEVIKKIMSELYNTENSKLFINSLTEFLPAMTVGYGLLVGNSDYWKNATDAKIARIFMFAFLNLDFTGLEEYMSAEHAFHFLCCTRMSSDSMIVVWPNLFDVNQYKDLGETALSEEEAKRSEQDRKRIIHMKRRQQLHKKLTGKDVTYRLQLTRVPFRSLSLVCNQLLMLKKAVVTQGQVYKNMTCLLQAGDPDSRNESFGGNVLADLREIAKLESLMASEDFTVSSLFIRYTKEFLIDRTFVLSQDFHALPLEVQGVLLSETRPDGIRPDEDTPTSIIQNLRSYLGIIETKFKQVFTATELESANKLDWFILDVVCPGRQYDYVLLQDSQYPGPLSSQGESKSILPERQYYRVLWREDKSSPNNCQYVGIACTYKGCTSPLVELLIVPTDDASDVSQRRAILKVSVHFKLNMAAIWWDPNSKLVRLRMMPFDNTVYQVTIPQHLISEDCPQEYGLEHRMIIVLSEYSLPTLEEAAQMLTMKDRQLHDLTTQTYFGEWSIVTIKPKCLANLEYAPEFPLARPNRLLAIASDFSDIQKLNPLRIPEETFTPSAFLVRIGKKLLDSVLMTSQNDSEMSKASWLAALEDLETDKAALQNEEIERDSNKTIKSCLSEHHWSYDQLIKGEYDVASLPAVMRFLWHQHRLMVACMLGCTQDALNWDASLASDLMALSMSDLVKDINSDTICGLISFFEQGFWNTASLEKKREWVQMMQYVHSHIKPYTFMSREYIPSTSLPVIQEHIAPVLSTPALARKQFVIRVKSIVDSEQAKANGFVDFVPALMSSNRLRISSNRSKLHYAIVDRMNPSKWSIHAPDVTKRYRIKNPWILIAHHCPNALMKLLRNYASYKRRGILVFVLLDEHFLVYSQRKLDLSN